MAATGQGAGQAAGAAGGDAGQAQQAAAEGQEQQGPDFGALVGQLEGLTSSHAETRQALDQVVQNLAAAPWVQEAAGPETPAPIDVDLSFLDATDPAFNPDQVGQQLTGLVNQLVEQGVQQHVQPIQAQQEEQRRQWEAAQLTSEFPELADPTTAQEVVQSAQQYAQALIPAIGQEAAQRLANEPGFWRVMYAAGRAFDAAQQEGSGDPGAAHLEGGGGANPGAGQQVDLGDQIVNAASGGRSVLPY